MTAARTLRSAQALAEAGLIASERLPALEAVAARYAVAITPDMAALIDPANESDPIARQFVPSEAELSESPGETATSPVGGGTYGPPPCRGWSSSMTMKPWPMRAPRL